MAGIRQRASMSGRVLGELSESQQASLARNEAAATSPFVGVHAPEGPVPGIFALAATGIPSEPLRRAAEEFLTTIGPDRAAVATFALDSDNWRRWSNIHRFLMRHGASLDELGDPGREAALGILRRALSESGFRLASDIMKLNGVIGEIAGRPEEFSEWLYWMSIFGEPSEHEPWGFQIDGHHLIVNCLCIGDQAVMTPMFMGSEPVVSEGGRFGRLRVFGEEESVALELMASLSAAERDRAVVAEELPGELFAVAFSDNVELAYEGVVAGDLGSSAKAGLLRLLEVYLGRLTPDRARLQMEEVAAHLDETHLSWRGGTEEDSVFYYRVHSPVILVEFDHQRGVVFDNDEPSRSHIHTVMRTPNGNDYGKDLLRQHYAAGDHAHSA